jgi:hypothetical protein
MLELPEDVWRNVAMHLSAPEILNFLSLHRRIHNSFANSDNSTFWKLVLERDSETEIDDSERNMKQAFLCKAYTSYLPSVQWHALRRSRITAREGHLACVLGAGSSRKICITGGFTDDSTIYVLHAPRKQSWSWSQIVPTGQRTFVYGATLTPLDQHRAIRFGGFLSGGYSNETNQLSILTMKEAQDGKPPSAEWQVQPTHNIQLVAARAYHSATLVGGRYLVVVGGMMWRESIIREAILDTHTWTWLEQNITSQMVDGKPSGRHGHSLVLDPRRNRLMLFGGGNGTDLLRSGKDNSEVWELNMGGDNWETDFQASLPWTWKQIHSDLTDLDQVEDNDSVSDSANVDDGDGEAAPESRPSPQISPAESLCLGRCHSGIRVSFDTVLFTFGSGRPSTNGVLGYDLRTDSFLHPKIQGSLPRPRFTGISVFLEADGYLFVHGGYSSQGGDAVGDMSVLDLAPALQRTFDKLPTETNARSYGQVRDDEAVQGRENRESLLQRMILSLNEAEQDERRVMASNMLGHMLAVGGANSRGFMLLNMIANGSAILGGSDSNDEDESDEYYEAVDDEEEEDEMRTDL